MSTIEKLKEQIDDNILYQTTNNLTDSIQMLQDKGEIIKISTAEELKKFAAAVNNGSKHKDSEYTTPSRSYLNAILTNNIIIPNEIDYSIGTKENPYRGIFDGQNYSIFYNSSKKINEDKNLGLFNYIQQATIKNLTIQGNIELNTDKTLDSNNTNIYIGSFCSVATNSIFQKCKNELNIQEIDYEKNSYSYPNIVGGLVGKAKNCYFEKCKNTGDIKGHFSTVGGIIGQSEEKLILKEISHRGDIIAQNSIGGLVGVLYNCPTVAMYCYCLADNLVSLTNENTCGNIIGKITQQNALKTTEKFEFKQLYSDYLNNNLKNNTTIYGDLVTSINNLTITVEKFFYTSVINNNLISNLDINYFVDQMTKNNNLMD